MFATATYSCNEFEVIADDDDRPASAAMRPAGPDSKAGVTAVFDYRPAPGQFINEDAATPITDSEQAAKWAMERLAQGYVVSLGAFGGYIVVGFDHSIAASGGYDFAVGANAFKNAGGASNEPGVVWVMQDTNANGLPDDQWYELRGCEYGSPEEKRNFTVTYYRPSEPAQPVRWEASDGTSGQVDHITLMHPQDYYYPLWLGSSISFTGTRLTSEIYRDPATGQWVSEPLAWGYADNVGSDAVEIEGLRGQFTGFKIANAVDAQGQSVGLQFIDFVKIQTGVLAQLGVLGECSTEVTGVYDLSL